MSDRFETLGKERDGFFIICQWHSYRKEEDLEVMRIFEYSLKNREEIINIALKDCRNYVISARKFWLENKSRYEENKMENDTKWQENLTVKLGREIDVKEGKYKEDGFYRDTVAFQVFDIKPPNRDHVVIDIESETTKKKLFLKIEYSRYERKPISFQWIESEKEKKIEYVEDCPFGDKLAYFCFDFEKISRNTMEIDDEFFKSWLYY